MSTKRWLLIFYTVPSKPVNNRMKLWRKLANAGAVQLKGAVYILPYTEEHHEFFQWLISEVNSTGGDGAFVSVEGIETITDDDIVTLFDTHREEEYRKVGKGIDEIERRLSSTRKGGRGQNSKDILDRFNKCRKDYDSIRRRDFFSSRAGRAIEGKLRTLEGELKKICRSDEGTSQPPRAMTIPLKKREEYRQKTWVTRKNPFVDRMASAWLIRRFIDKEAVFRFLNEEELAHPDTSIVTFDVRGAAFTHVSDLCTFEVLLKSFSLKDKALRLISEIVHEIDVKDGKYDRMEAKGIEDILTGIRRTAKDDVEALDKGMAIFEMLYISKTR